MSKINNIFSNVFWEGPYDTLFLRILIFFSSLSLFSSTSHTFNILVSDTLHFQSGRTLWCICSISCLVFHFSTAEPVRVEYTRKENWRNRRDDHFCRLYLKLFHFGFWRTKNKKKRNIQIYMQFSWKMSKMNVGKWNMLNIVGYMKEKATQRENGNELAFSGCHTWRPHMRKTGEYFKSRFSV